MTREDLDAMEAEVARLLAEAKAQEAKLQTLADARKYAQRLESEQDDRVAWAYARMHRASKSCEAAWDAFEGRTPSAKSSDAGRFRSLMRELTNDSADRKAVVQPSAVVAAVVETLEQAIATAEGAPC